MRRRRIAWALLAGTSAAFAVGNIYGVIKFAASRDYLGLVVATIGALGSIVGFVGSITEATRS